MSGMQSAGSGFRVQGFRFRSITEGPGGVCVV